MIAQLLNIILLESEKNCSHSAHFERYFLAQLLFSGSSIQP
jgi:hypothetical protein